MSRAKKLHVSNIEDPRVQQNFKTLGDIFQSVPFMKGQWRFVEYSIPASGSNLKLSHNLEFMPQDVILTSQIGGSVVFNYDKFDATFLDVTATVTSTPLIFRAIIGKYTEGSPYV